MTYNKGNTSQIMTGNSACTYRFIPSSLADLPSEREYDIVLRQQPERAKMSVPNERDRRPIEPPPILQMKWSNCTHDQVKKSLQSPFYFLVANIVTEDEPSTLLLPSQDYLSGSTVSSLYRLRDIDNSDGGFFVFGDLAVKKEGKYRLHFSLFEIVEGTVENRKTMLSDAFTVYLPKRYPGPTEATFLSRTFCDQGVKMRIRKEHRLPSVSGRKRRVEHTTPVEEEQPSHSSKRKGGSVALSVYATTGVQKQGVHFGQWQSSSSTASSLSSSPNSMNTTTANNAPANIAHVYESYPSAKDKYDHILPSPCSSQYRWEEQQQQQHHRALPSPPQQFSSDLAHYHFDGSGQQQHPSVAYSRQLTPPPMLTEANRHPPRMGDRLPPLRSIMADTLLLPPLSSSPHNPSASAGRVSIHQLLQ
ncbi:developmental regulator [Lichtheimia corymbifera JMRC:FSU:9682]|uniref:Developmental regulator n=1 Tax=Lichtheimia corymbifera JMRC:FSU:9682 TaxID=1263082 RepID=A0A068S0J3_9FUNG|nr:developmental regulator [Lichtheimia corymbifera JMRC:FSU:9682]